MSGSLVTYTLEGHVARITLNRPEAMNAMNVAMLQDLHAAADRFAADEEAWVAVLHGEGRSFCTGGDLKESLELLDGNPGNLYVLPRTGIAAIKAMKDAPKPTICAVHGYAVAGGLLLANACHLIVAGESAKFGIPETKVGMPTMGYLDLWKTMGPRKFMEATFTGDNFTAQEGVAMGLVNRVVPDDQVLEEAMAMARKIAGNSPRSVQGHVQAITMSVKHTPDVLEDLQRLIWDKVVFSEDLQEGLTAFGERRKPEWKNR